MFAGVLGVGLRYEQVRPHVDPRGKGDLIKIQEF